jgi:hypothetical protein
VIVEGEVGRAGSDVRGSWVVDGEVGMMGSDVRGGHEWRVRCE